MKKTALKTTVTLVAAMVCSVMTVCAAPTSFVPVGCPVKQPCCTEKPCESCNPCDSCEKPKCEAAPVFESCEEVQNWKNKFFEKRCELYTKLGLSQEQRVKAKCVDEKYFDEYAALKICCKQEKAKLKDMECKKCSWHDRHEQKQKIKDIKCEMKDKKRQHKECFMDLLSCCQKSQYKKLTKEKCKCACDCE